MAGDLIPKVGSGGEEKPRNPYKGRNRRLSIPDIHDDVPYKYEAFPKYVFGRKWKKAKREDGMGFDTIPELDKRLIPAGPNAKALFASLLDQGFVEDPDDLPTRPDQGGILDETDPATLKARIAELEAALSDGGRILVEDPARVKSNATSLNTADMSAKDAIAAIAEFSNIEGLTEAFANDSRVSVQKAIETRIDELAAQAGGDSSDE